MSITLLQSVMQADTLHRPVLTALADAATDDGSFSVSWDQLCKTTGMRQGAVRASLRTLNSDRWIAVWTMDDQMVVGEVVK